jgi:hypothetical protein
MRLSSFRALILVVAIAVQAVAGAWGVARTAPGPLTAGISEHCVKQSDAGGAGDPRHGGAHRMCESCLLCGGPPSLFIGEFAPVLALPQAFKFAGFIVADASGIPARFARSSLARGPPAEALSA